jgi:predicted transcriptional regulator
MPSHSTNGQDLIERFIAAYNGIDQELRHRVKLDRFATFSQTVDLYSARYPSWLDGRTLKQYADLRNFISHVSTEPYARLAVPTLQVVEGIEAIKANLSQRIIPRFARKVTALKPDDTLSQVLKVVKETSFSQFPVQELNGPFRGLLTENGTTRWLAHHTVAEMALVDFDDVRVAVVIGKEETDSNYMFVSRNASVNDVFSQFARHPLLEAVLITHSGKWNESLLGIVTRWDVLDAGQGAA